MKAVHITGVTRVLLSLFMLLSILFTSLVYAQGDISNVGVGVTDTLLQAQKQMNESKKQIFVGFIRLENRMVILQSKSILDQDVITALIRKYEPSLRQAATDTQREKQLGLAAAEIQSDLELFSSIANIDISYKKETQKEGAQQKPVAQTVCALLKDGICDRACPSVDLDCQCGNNKCDSYENHDTCPVDCKPQRTYLCAIASDNICDPDCSGVDIDCKLTSLIDKTVTYYEKHENFYSRFMTILSVVIVILSGLSLWLLHDIYKIKVGE